MINRTGKTLKRHPQPDARPGTYALLLRIAAAEVALIGRQGRLPLAPGWAVYAGSAFGPGGVAARLAHHRRPVVRPHWHIDYLRRHGSLAAVWFSHDPVRRECLWAAVLAGELGGTPPPFRFGASDCRCPAHLYLFRERPALAAFAAALRVRCPDHAMAIEELIPFPNGY
ncbi:MAG: GIY-YIG nuclease family protein [Candidatus Competibacter sp.]|nr:GIY-YIG nuclease family protein [Candidatus Competibacter sp.]